VEHTTTYQTNAEDGQEPWRPFARRAATQGSVESNCTDDAERTTDYEVGDLDTAEVSEGQISKSVVGEVDPGTVTASIKPTITKRGPASTPQASILLVVTALV
jgi:hypothetical protein